MNPYLFNESNIVRQAIDGNLNVSSGKLARVADPHHKIVVRSDYEVHKDKVAIISGGGAGHEPLHSEFVGSGMLTAAVSGEIFASPSVNAILTAILLVTGDKGCLLIVKNYTGDRLNFALAAERAKVIMGKNIEILLVADDMAIENPEKRRGIAGTVLIHKIAGYLSEQGFSLAEIKNKCEQASKGLFSLGFSMSAADSHSGSQLSQFNPQLGRGIHNEAGKTFTFNSENRGQEAVKKVLKELVSKTEESSFSAILINNLGGLTRLEMSIITQEILNSPFKDRLKYVIGPAEFCTSLNMAGFSLSLLALTDDIENALVSPVEPRAWIEPVIPVAQQLIDVSHLNLRYEYTPSENEERRRIINRICEVVIASREQLNNLDGKAGDGDCGYTLATIATHIQAELDNLPLNELPDLLLAIGQLLQTTGVGTSGVLLSLVFIHTEIALKTGLNFPTSLKQGVEVMISYAGSRLGDRSMIDSLVPAIEALEQKESLQTVAQKAREGADSTSGMIAKVGRAANISPEVYLDTNDSGAEAIALIFECLAKQE